MRLDSKVHGTLIKNKDGTEIPKDEFIVFRPHDNALLTTLKVYRLECEAIGADDEQLLAVDQLIRRVEEWRSLHPDRCKVADVQPGELRLE
jgi:hypothetical protein